MDKNDYDIDYDFEKELGIDPKEFTDSPQGDDFDLSEFQNIDMNQDDLDLSQFGIEGDYQQDSFDDFDLDGIDLGDIPGDTGDDVQPEGEEPYADSYGENYEDAYGNQEPAYEEGEEEILRRPRKNDLEDPDPEAYDNYEESQGEYPQEEYAEDENSQEAYSEEEYTEPEEYPEEDQEPVKKKKARKEKNPRREIHIQKPSVPPIFHNFMAIYFGPAIAELTGMVPEDGRRRRSRQRIFKEAYLPPIILIAALIVCISCVVGSVSTLVDKKHVNDEQIRQESIAASEEEDRLQGEYVRVMDEADVAAQEYDFEKAIAILDSYTGDAPQELNTKRAEFAQMAAQMVEWKDPTGIPNLSFHCLVADPARAYANKDLGGKYNQNFVTTDEFQRILESLYANNYVLVDFDSFVETTQATDGTESFSIKPILLPDGKKPVMLTETLVSYYDYMIDSNKDGKPDAGGSGFASRLVVDANGDIKAEMVDKDGNTVVGDYDLVPILESFLKVHPDFSYRGSRAILAPTGEQGIFGYRIQTSVISDPKFGQTYYNEQVQGAKEIVQALRDKGYTMACYTYGNANYGQNNATQITEDLASWDTQITPVIGNTNIMVFAHGTDIGDYTGTKYKALYDKGFRFFIGQSDKPFADVSNAYVRQKRLMVTGSNMFWNGKMFSGMFDTAAVLNSMRGDVPKAK